VYTDPNGKSHNLSVCSKFLKGIISLNRDGVPVVDFWSIENSLFDDNPNCISKNTELGRFEIQLEQRKTLGEKSKYILVPFRAWTWGVGTTPFRLRPPSGPSELTISSNLGVSVNFGRTFGWSTISKRSMNNFSITVGPFIGLSSVDLRKSSVKNPDSWTTDRTNGAFSYGMNTIYARNNFGFVASVGFDHNFGEDSKEWSFQNQPWVGIGINTSLGIH
jgi:hypothetical protein